MKRRHTGADPDGPPPDELPDVAEGVESKNVRLYPEGNALLREKQRMHVSTHRKMEAGEVSVGALSHTVGVLKGSRVCTRTYERNPAHSIGACRRN